MRIAIITTHPIQYYAPVFQLLQQQDGVNIKVFYTWGKKAIKKFDPDFEKNIDWDIPLLDGYEYEWVKNTSANPGSHHFNGIVNPNLIPQVIAWQPEAILVYGWAYHAHLKVIRFFKNKIPIYFRGDSTLLDVRNDFKAFLKKIYLKWVYRQIDHAFYVGSNNKAYFKKYGLKEDQLSFAPHAIDNDRFAVNRTADALKLRQTLAIPPGDLLILFAGKFEEKKSPHLLIDAFCSLGVQSSHLLFVGNGHLEKSLKAKADKIKNIYFLDFQNQSIMPAIYQACDLFCLPSKGPGETWGLAVNEAMASGKPVLVSDRVGCQTDLVIPGFTGEVFKTENLFDITEKLGMLLKNKDSLKTLGINAKSKIAEWSFDQQVAAIKKTIRKKSAK